MSCVARDASIGKQLEPKDPSDMRLSFFAFITLLSLPAIALADLPPDPDYVEQCTLEKQAKPGLACKPCSASFRDAQHCASDVGAGFTRACRSRGASVWTEIWCQPFGNPLLDAGVSVPDAGIDAGPAPAAAAAAADADDDAPILARESAGVEADGGGCSALGARSPSLAGLLLVAGWLALRLRRRAER